MGAVFSVPLARAAGPDALPGAKIALVPGQGRPLNELPLPGELTLLLGAERSGLPAEIAERADLITHIPTANDSLNVAMAATVALYELANRMARK